MGFVPWPLRCGDCTRRIPMTPQMAYGTAVRCEGCRKHSFVVVFAAVELAFVVALTWAEWRDMAARSLSTREVLRELGALGKVA